MNTTKRTPEAKATTQQRRKARALKYSTPNPRSSR
jgi:hypothetical protein